MSANSLTKKQIDSLFEFVSNRNVPYKDVQFEIVDHLASAIEDEMEQDASLDFDHALDLVYGRFPITGFGHFTLEKEKALKKYWRRAMWKMSVNMFFSPVMLCVVCVFLVSYVLMSTYGGITIIPMVVVALAAVAFGFYSYKDSISGGVNVDDYLVLKTFGEVTWLGSPYGFLAVFFLRDVHFFSGATVPMYSKLFLSMLITFYLVWAYVARVYFPSLIKKEMETFLKHH